MRSDMWPEPAPGIPPRIARTRQASRRQLYPRAGGATDQLGPHVRRIIFEHEIRISLRHPPPAAGKLFVQLARRPARVPGEREKSLGGIVFLDHLRDRQLTRAHVYIIDNMLRGGRRLSRFEE